MICLGRMENKYSFFKKNMDKLLLRTGYTDIFNVSIYLSNPFIS